MLKPIGIWRGVRGVDPWKGRKRVCIGAMKKRPFLLRPAFASGFWAVVTVLLFSGTAATCAEWVEVEKHDRSG